MIKLSTVEFLYLTGDDLQLTPTLKTVIFTLVSFMILGCTDYRYNVSSLPSLQMRFSDLPDKVQVFFNDPSDFKHITEDGIEYGFKDLICLDTASDYAELLGD